MSDKLTAQKFIQASAEHLPDLAKQAKEQGIAQKIAERITGQEYEPAKVVAALKALSKASKINYLRLIGRSMKPDVIKFLLEQEKVVKSDDAQKAAAKLIKMDQVGLANIFLENGVQIDAVKIALNSGKPGVASKLVQTANVTTEHFLNTNPESILPTQCRGPIKRKLDPKESNLEVALKLFATKTEATLPTMKQVFDSFICNNKDFNNIKLTTNQTLWFKIGTKVFCNNTDNFMPTSAPVVETRISKHKTDHSHSSYAELACLNHNEVMGITDNLDCQNL